MRIKQLPNVLAVHLKRFKYHERLQRHKKLSWRVAHPTELRLFNSVGSTVSTLRKSSVSTFRFPTHLTHLPSTLSLQRQTTPWTLTASTISLAP